jgi:LmbE family N-acetylglucosaminyl deacetylase
MGAVMLIEPRRSDAPCGGTIVLHVDMIPLLLAAAVLICSVLAGTPKPLRDPPRDVLICSAHSDDCVIMGAEYAYGAVQNGLSVRIAYLTCSGPDPDAEISQTRRVEALAAWSALGVPKENLAFINLSQSPINGPPSYSDRDIEGAREIFKTIILSLPKNAAVIVPARGESHVDHRTVREVSLHAVVDSKRDDLLVYETPEYNALLSLVHCPKRTIWTVLRHLPSLNRLVKPYAGPSNYVNGPPGFVFRDTPGRLAKKKELLTYFPSQDGDLLVRLFGYETPYRRVALSEHLRGPNKALCFSAFGRCCDPSALALGFAVLGMLFFVGHKVARGLTIALSPALPVDKGLALLGGLVASAYFVRRVRRTASLETSLFAWAAAFGLISGAL